MCPWFSRKGHRNPSCPAPLCLCSGLLLQEAFLDISSHTPFSFLAFHSPSCVTGFGIGHTVLPLGLTGLSPHLLGPRRLRLHFCPPSRPWPEPLVSNIPFSTDG